MNIFYLHNNPKVCAEQHVDKHVVKMIVEYAQLLSTAHRSGLTSKPCCMRPIVAENEPPP